MSEENVATGCDTVLRIRSDGSGAQQHLTGGIERMGGISVGGITVVIGIVVAIFWSVLWGVIIALIGLIAFGGFARGKWY
jgi:type IV secretory pathway TrbD component